MYTFDEQIVSDLHKDARGYRPSEYFWEEWSQCGDDTRQSMWDNLLEELAAETARQKDAYARAEIEFHQRVQGTMLAGAKDELTAIRWILEAEQLSKFDLAYGSDYVAWHFGLPYKGEFDQQIQTVIDAMTKEEA
jgi:hypothetical protein